MNSIMAFFEDSKNMHFRELFHEFKCIYKEKSFITLQETSYNLHFYL